ncbi:MAG: PHP domain-containing protein [Nitrospira sp.]|nr:PHP domain-containing protein [Nitrospira sp.]
MLVDMHIHTRFSPCSSIRIAQLLKRAREVGIDAICITDHDTIAAKSIIENGVDSSGICVIVGIEYTTTKGDFLIFGPIEYIPKGMAAEGLLKWIKKEGGVAIPAHPFRKSRPVDIRILPSFEIVEALNGRNHESENESCKNWIKRHGDGVKEIGGSDAHTIAEVGQTVTVFDNNIYSVEDLIKELRNGNYSPLQRYPLKTCKQVGL